MVTLISQASKVMLKILQARFQQYGNRELPDVQAGFRKGRGTRNQIANTLQIIAKAREFQKHIWSEVKWKWREVTQSCLTLCDPMDFSLPGFSVHGILQARILEWVTISFCRGSSWPRDWTQVSLIAGGFFTIWASRDAQVFWSR